MAARRPGPAAASPRGTDARPTRGRISGDGGASALRGCQRGLPPRQHTPRPCLGAASPLGTRGRQRMSWEARGGNGQKSLQRPQLELLSALAGVPRPPTPQCHSCSCPVPAQREGHVTLVPARLPQLPDSSPRSPAMANYGLMPLQQHIPPPLRARCIPGD